MAHYSGSLSYTARLKACSKSSDEILGTLCEPCSEVGKRVEAKGYCCTCSQYLCTDCCKYHKTLRTLRNHKLLEGSDYVQATRGSMHCFEMCHLHKQRRLDQYCKTHEQLCCRMCVRTLHQECKEVNFIKDISEGIKHDSATKKNCDGIRSSLQQLKHHRKRYDDCIKDASSQHRDAAAAIEAFTATLKERLNRSEKNANSELKSCYEKDLSDLEEHRSMVDTAIAELEEAVQKLDDALERGDNDSVFIHLVKAKQKNTEYNVLAEEPPKEQKLQFLPNKELDRQTGIPQMLGRVELRRLLPLPGRVVPSSREPKVAKHITHGTCRHQRPGTATLNIGWLSGFAFSHHGHWGVMSKQWTDTRRINTPYPPCNACIDPGSNSLVAYGSEAENKYNADREEGVRETKYYYFPKFDAQLQRLFEENATNQSELILQDAYGRQYPAKKLLCSVMRFLLSCLLSMYQERRSGIEKCDIDWVLTLPAIWWNGAEEVVFEAAIEAGLEADNVAFTYTSQAAFAYCRDTVREVKDGQTRDGKVIQLYVGEVFTELTIHQMRGSDENIHAIRGWWGSENVKENYDLLLGELFGPDEVKEFKKTADGRDASYLDDFMMRTTTRSVLRRPVNIRIPVEFLCGVYRADIGKGTMYEGGITCKRGAILSMEEWVVRSMFKPVVDGSINLLQTIMEQDIGRNISVLVMTGNLSQSEILHGAIREAFPELKVVQPERPMDAVGIGACKHTTVVARYM